MNSTLPEHRKVRMNPRDPRYNSVKSIIHKFRNSIKKMAALKADRTLPAASQVSYCKEDLDSTPTTQFVDGIKRPPSKSASNMLNEQRLLGNPVSVAKPSHDVNRVGGASILKSPSRPKQTLTSAQAQQLLQLGKQKSIDVVPEKLQEQLRQIVGGNTKGIRLIPKSQLQMLAKNSNEMSSNVQSQKLLQLSKAIQLPEAQLSSNAKGLKSASPVVLSLKLGKEENQHAGQQRVVYQLEKLVNSPSRPRVHIVTSPSKGASSEQSTSLLGTPSKETYLGRSPKAISPKILSMANIPETVASLADRGV